MRQAAERNGLHLAVNALIDSFLLPSFEIIEEAMENVVPIGIRDMLTKSETEDYLRDDSESSSA